MRESKPLLKIRNEEMESKKLEGILIVNKPENMTSHDVVYQIRKIVKEKVGHTGTLDPLATGVLPLLIRKRDKAFKIFSRA